MADVGDTVLKSVRALLIADGTITGYVSTRVVQGWLPVPGVKFPHITINIDLGDSHNVVPRTDAMLWVKAWFGDRGGAQKTNCRLCGGRVIELLDKQTVDMQGAGFSLKCYYIVKSVAVMSYEVKEKLHQYSISFDMKVGM